jgi:hypothetical protein
MHVLNGEAAPYKVAYPVFKDPFLSYRVPPPRSRETAALSEGGPVSAWQPAISPC